MLLAQASFMHEERAAVADRHSPGRLFIRRLINLSTRVKHFHYRVRLNKETLADLHWWDIFMTDCNDSFMLQLLGRARPMVSVRSDASGR